VCRAKCIQVREKASTLELGEVRRDKKFHGNKGKAKDVKVGDFVETVGAD